jgi:ketosteroid isomerase-like protein
VIIKQSPWTRPFNRAARAQSSGALDPERIQAFAPAWSIRGDLNMTKIHLAGAGLAALMLLGVSACTPPKAAKASVDTAKVADAIKADVAQGVTAFNAKDADKAVALDADDFVGMFHGAPNVSGKAADLAATKQAYAADPSGKVSVSDESVDVASSGDVAVYRATYSFTGTDPKTKKPISETGNWLLGLKAQADGSWKIAWSVVSNTAAAPAMAPAAPAKTKS